MHPLTNVGALGVAAVRPFVFLSVRLSPEMHTQKQFSQKLSSLELWSLLTTSRKSYMGFTKNPFLAL